MSATIKKGLWNIYDHLGGLIITNLVWFLVMLPVFLLAAGFLIVPVAQLGPAGIVSSTAAATVLIWLCPPTVAVLTRTWVWAEYGRMSLTDMWPAFKLRWWTSLILMVLSSLTILVLGGNAWFYFDRFPENLTWVGMMLGGLMLWGALFVVSASFHAAIIIARMPDLSVKQVLRQSIALAVGRPVKTLLVLAMTMGLVVVLVISKFGLLLFFVTMPAMFACTAQRELLKDCRDTTPEDVENDRLEEVRTLRDLIKPWE